MGDRANVIIHQGREEPAVWLYTHWNGTELPQMLAVALDTPQAKARVGDAPYLTKIVCCQIIKQADGIDSETGWGISTSEGDNGHPYIHLDADKGRVCIDRTASPTAQGDLWPWSDIAEFVAAYKDGEGTWE